MTRRLSALSAKFIPAILLASLLAYLTPASYAQMTPPAKPPATLRSTLLSELHSAHDKAEWFVPVNTAIAGMTAEQAKWVPTNAAGKVDANVNHSVGMITYHLLFWNTYALAQLKGEKTAPDPGNNTETFNNFDPASWQKSVHDLDSVLTAIEDLVAKTDDANLAKIAPVIAHIATHNAYHTGQIIYVRKLQGSWNPDNGVK
jgi:DinB superfamily